MGFRLNWYQGLRVNKNNVSEPAAGHTAVVMLPLIFNQEIGTMLSSILHGVLLLLF